MSVLSSKKNRFNLCSLATAIWRRIALGGSMIAVSVTAVLRGGAQNAATPEPNVGIVGGTVEDVTGAIVPKAELTAERMLSGVIQEFVPRKLTPP
jgi:hypothetical protein